MKGSSKQIVWLQDINFALGLCREISKALNESIEQELKEDLANSLHEIMTCLAQQLSEINSPHEV